MLAQLQSEQRFTELAGYFKASSEHLYSVLYEVNEPVARILLVGSFASERHFSYHPWVRWARYLAGRRIEVLRYDYRGVGESTGVFEEMAFGDWREDVRLLSQWMASRSPRLPFMLHGLEIGAILAGKAFDEGLGDALLLWSPPETANHALRSSLLRWAGLEQLYESTENRRTAAEFIRQLEQGSPIEVAGYQWTSRLWSESFDFDLPSPLADENEACQHYGKPVRIVRLGKDAAPLVKPYVGYDEVKDLHWLYSHNFEWVAEALALPKGKNEPGN